MKPGIYDLMCVTSNSILKKTITDTVDIDLRFDVLKKSRGVIKSRDFIR